MNDAVQTDEDTPVVVNVLANDTGAGLRVGSVGQPAHGTAVVLDASAGTIRYAPSPDWNGMDSFSYTITEGNSMYCATTGHYYQYVAGSITWANAWSAAASKTLYGLQGYLVTITSAAEQTFVNTKLNGNTAWMGASDEGSEGVWRWVTGPEQGQQFCQETGGGGYAGSTGGYTATGSWYNNWNGGEPNNAGDEDYGQFLAGDTGLWNDLSSSATVAGYVVEYGGMAGDAPAFPTATVTVTVNSVNDAPVIAEGSAVSVAMDEDSYPTVFALMLHAGDVDGDALSWHIQTPAGHGTASVDAAGSVHYVPNTNWNGSDSFAVQVSDGHGGSAATTVAVTVRPRNDPPVNTVLPVLSGTPHPGRTLTVTTGTWNDDIDAPLTGSFAYRYYWQRSSDGGITWANINGVTTSGSYLVTQNDQGYLLRCAVDCLDHCNGNPPDVSGEAYSNVVTGVNAVPFVQEGSTGSVTMKEDGSSALTLHASDADGDALSWTVSVPASHGMASISSVGSTATVQYAPVADWNGMDSFVVQASDPYGGRATVTVQATVTPVNDAPSFTKGPDQTVPEDCGAQAVTGWATAITAGPMDEAGQTLGFHVSNTNAPLFSVQPSVDAAGTLRYTPAPDANGMAAVTVVLQDSGGTADGGVDTSASQTFAMTVTPVDDAPVVSSLSLTVAEDSSFSGILLAADVDSPSLTYSIVSLPSHGTVLVTDASTGAFTYTPAPDFNGVDSFTFRASDGSLDSTAATASVTVVPVADVVPDAVATPEDTSASFNVLTGTNGASADTFENPSRYLSAVTQGSNGATVTFLPDGTVTYTPATDWNGADSFTYTVTSPEGVTENGTVTMVVEEVNDAPSFTKGPGQTVLEDCGAQTVTGWATAITAGPVDESSQTLSFHVTGMTAPSLFSILPSIAPNGTLTYTTAPDANGTAVVTVTLQDNGGTANGGSDTSAPQTFLITVIPVNDAPSFVRGADIVVDEDALEQTITAWATAISAGPADEAGQQLTFTVTNDNPVLFTKQPSLSPDGTLSYSVAPGRNGVAHLTVTLTDDGTAGGAALTTSPRGAVITVNPVNDPPVCLQLPAVTGTGVVGTIMTGDAGLWDDHLDQTPGHVGIVMQWVRSSMPGGTGALPIPGATGLTYRVQEGDAGSCIGLLVTAVDDGEGTPSSMQTSAFAPVWIKVIENDTTPPSVTLLHDVPAKVMGSSFVLDGIVWDAGSGIRTVTLDGVPIVLYADSSFRETVKVCRGENGVTLTATDNAGNTWSRTYHVTGETAPAAGPQTHTITLNIGSRVLDADGRRVPLDAAPMLRKGRTMVPFRAIVESLGGTVSWNARTRQVTIKARGRTIVLTVGSGMAVINGNRAPIDGEDDRVAPFLLSGHVYIPLRFIAGQLGVSIDWDVKAQSIKISWDD